MKTEATINIDLDVYKKIIQNSNYIDESPNSVLRRLLQVDHHSSSVLARSGSKRVSGLTVKGVFYQKE